MQKKNEVKEKIIKLKIEKKMWNVKRHGETSETTQSYIKPYFSVDDIKQGGIGDCWLEATLKSMALKSPNKLLKLFPNYLKEVSFDGYLSGNQVTVRLYDYSEPKSEPKDDSDIDYDSKPKPKNYIRKFIPGKIKEMTVYATEINWNKGKTLWPSVIEKAIDKLIEEFHHDDKPYNYGRHINGGTGSKAHVILTGKSSSVNQVDANDPKNTLYKLNKALKESYAPTCSTKSNFGIKVDGQREEEQRIDFPNAKEVRFLFTRHA